MFVALKKVGGVHAYVTVGTQLIPGVVTAVPAATGPLAMVMPPQVTVKLATLSLNAPIVDTTKVNGGLLVLVIVNGLVVAVPKGPPEATTTFNALVSEKVVSSNHDKPAIVTTSAGGATAASNWELDPMHTVAGVAVVEVIDGLAFMVTATVAGSEVQPWADVVVNV